MTFTESDAQNDGLIKREVGRELAKVMKTQNPQMFQYFENVCEELGRAPPDVFGEMAVRSLNSEDYAQQVLNSEVNMGQIKADEIRMEDVKYVKQLSEELGLNETDSTKDPIDQLINQRLEMVTQSPLDNIRKGRESPEGVNGEVLDHMESLQNEIGRLKQEIEGDGGQTATDNQTAERDDQSVDDLFGESNDADGQGDTGDEEPVDTVEMGNEGEQEEVVIEPDGEDQGPSSEELDEALEGTDSTVDDVWNEDEAEELDTNIDIPAETMDDDGIVTSEDGEEE